MLGDVLRGLGSDSAAGVRRLLSIIVLVAGIVFLGFVAWIVLQVRASNDWAEIRQVFGPIVAWAVLAVVTACAAVIVDASERRNALRLAAARAGAAATESGAMTVSTHSWRGSALAGLAFLAFSLALVSSTQIGHLRSITAFDLRGRDNVAPCVAKIWSPAIALTDDHVPIDLSVYCANAPPNGMPAVAASYGSDNVKVVTSFAAAKTTRPGERVWRWFVTFGSGEQPLDVHLTFIGDQIAVPLDRIAVSKPTTLGTLTEDTTAIGGLLGAVIGVLGTLGSLFKGWRGQSSTVVTTDQS
ncbi:MAG TPA: hypothetical protein VGX96_11955 [Candidatus Elarobacter sp.]|jgi:hypothetical protein|nr:hypothetical protein [Candidatus Elarobacter sp.]